MKNFCSLKDTIQRVKWQATEQEKVFGGTIKLHIIDKGLISKIYKRCLCINKDKANNQTEKKQKNLYRYVTKDKTNNQEMCEKMLNIVHN